MKFLERKMRQDTQNCHPRKRATLKIRKGI